MYTNIIIASQEKKPGQFKAQRNVFSIANHLLSHKFSILLFWHKQHYQLTKQKIQSGKTEVKEPKKAQRNNWLGEKMANFPRRQVAPEIIMYYSECLSSCTHIRSDVHFFYFLCIKSRKQMDANSSRYKYKKLVLQHRRPTHL